MGLCRQQNRLQPLLHLQLRLLQRQPQRQLLKIQNGIYRLLFSLVKKSENCTQILTQIVMSQSGHDLDNSGLARRMWKQI